MLSTIKAMIIMTQNSLNQQSNKKMRSDVIEYLIRMRSQINPKDRKRLGVQEKVRLSYCFNCHKEFVLFAKRKHKCESCKQWMEMTTFVFPKLNNLDQYLYN